MRGEDQQQHEFFGYGSLEERVPPNHPFRPVRVRVDEALQALDDGVDSATAVAAALLLRMLYSIRSEPMLMELEGEIAEEFSA